MRLADALLNVEEDLDLTVYLTANAPPPVAIRKVLATKKRESDPRRYLPAARDTMKQVCIDRMVAFSQAGNGGNTTVRFYYANQSPDRQGGVAWNIVETRQPSTPRRPRRVALLRPP